MSTSDISSHDQILSLSHDLDLSICIQFNFKKDLEWCPMFHKLRTFYLVDWCLSGDLHALLSILQHTTNLQKITLQLCQVYIFQT